MEYNCENVTSVSDAFEQLFGKEFLADVEFKLSSGDEVSYAAHSFVLSLWLWSKPFQELFRSKTFSQSDRLIIPITDERITQEGLLNFLQILYIDDSEIGEHYELEIMLLAKTYAVSELERKSTELILKNIDSDFVWEVLDFSIEEEWTMIKQKAIDYISKYFLIAIQSSAFLNINHRTLHTVLELNLMSEKYEFCIFDSVMYWAKIACEKEDISSLHVENIRTVLGPILYLIRFDSMTHECFEKCLEQEPGLLQEEEIEEIKLNITTNKLNAFGFYNYDLNLDNIEDVGERFTRQGKCLVGFHIFPVVKHPVKQYTMKFKVRPSIILTGFYMLSTKGRLTLRIVGNGTVLFKHQCHSYSGWKKVDISPGLQLQQNTEYEIIYKFSCIKPNSLRGWDNSYSFLDMPQNNTACGEVFWDFIKFCPQINYLFYKY